MSVAMLVNGGDTPQKQLMFTSTEMFINKWGFVACVRVRESLSQCMHKQRDYHTSNPLFSVLYVWKYAESAMNGEYRANNVQQ